MKVYLEDDDERLSRGTMDSSTLWVRLGDAGEYVPLDSVMEAIQYLREQGVKGPISEAPTGFAAPGYAAGNYISIFWGDEVGNFDRQIHSSDFTHVRESLR